MSGDFPLFLFRRYFSGKFWEKCKNSFFFIPCRAWNGCIIFSRKLNFVRPVDMSQVCENFCVFLGHFAAQKIVLVDFHFLQIFCNNEFLNDENIRTCNVESIRENSPKNIVAHGSSFQFCLCVFVQVQKKCLKVLRVLLYVHLFICPPSVFSRSL